MPLVGLARKQVIVTVTVLFRERVGKREGERRREMRWSLQEPFVFNLTSRPVMGNWWTEMTQGSVN